MAETTGQLLAFPSPIRDRDSGQAQTRESPGLNAIVDRLTILGEISPERPVSVVIVSLPGDPGWEAAALAEGVVRANVRAVDTVVALGDGRIGVVLQGSGPREASETAGRVQHRLQRSPLFHGMAVTIAAASGIGQHGQTLLKAASTSLPDCG